MVGRENTIGAVHWGAMFAGTDGEQITLIIPAFFQAHHMPFLNGILKSRLGDFFDEDQVSFRLEAGELERSQGGSNYEPGRIIITGIREPWPDGEALRTALEEAFELAGGVETDQLRRADDLVRHLRTTGDRASDRPAS
jgi:hypothetical protein